MNNKEFKSIFGEIIQNAGFSTKYGCWYKESEECIFVLDFQKSNFKNSFYLNIKIYVQKVFNHHYVKNKELFKNDPSDIFRRQPPEYSYLFDLNKNIPLSERKKNWRIFVTAFYRRLAKSR